MDLAERIAILKQPQSVPSYDILGVCEVLLSMVQQAQADLTVLMEAQVRQDQEIHALKRLASTYQEPRG